MARKKSKKITEEDVEEQIDVVCNNCGNILGGQSFGGLCQMCFREKFKTGIGSTTDRSDIIMHDIWNRKLDNPLSEETNKYIEEILSEFKVDRWICTKCNEIRTDGDEIQLSSIEIKEKLLESCPKCGGKGFLKHLRKGRGGNYE